MKIDWRPLKGHRILTNVIEPGARSDRKGTPRTYLREVTVEAVTTSEFVRISFVHTTEPTVWGYVSGDAIHIDDSIGGAGGSASLAL